MLAAAVRRSSALSRARLVTATDLLPDAHQLTYVDIDPSHVRVYGAKKQGAQYGRLKGKRTLHPLLGTISTPTGAPLVGPVRLRRGKAADVRGAVSFVTEAIATTRAAGATGTILVRARLQVLHRRGRRRLPPRRGAVLPVRRHQPGHHRHHRHDR
jgi:hypothetical protein